MTVSTTRISDCNCQDVNGPVSVLWAVPFEGPHKRTLWRFVNRYEDLAQAAIDDGGRVAEARPVAIDLRLGLADALNRLSEGGLP